jgi:hypothetical protein
LIVTGRLVVAAGEMDAGFAGLGFGRGRLWPEDTAAIRVITVMIVATLLIWLIKTPFRERIRTGLSPMQNNKVTSVLDFIQFRPTQWAEIG